MLPPVLDVEASGLGRGSYPIEVGFADEQGQTCAYLILPESDWTHWDPEAEGLHGIPREQLLQEGLPVGEVARALNEQLQGKTLYSDAWSHDSSWLALLFYTAGIPQRFKLQSLHAILSPQQLSRWPETRDRIASEQQLRRHRACDDARLLQQTYQATR